MAVIIHIEEKGVSDVAVLARTSEEGRKLVSLFHQIEPEIRAFEDVINEKLNPGEAVDLKPRE